MEPTADALTELLDAVTTQRPDGRTELLRLKRELARRHGTGLVRNDALLRRYREDVTAGRRTSDGRVEQVLQLNAIRSSSGIATVTVITEPYACPGRCVYCPTEARAPKSYLPNEPAILRALRNGYDPYRQVVSRLEALHQTGHPTDKVELIVKGGTWSFYPDAYQRWFVARCFDAANAFGSDAPAGEPSPLAEAQQRNETAATRVIGVTIETRPDYVTPEEILRLRELGVTRVELGAQSLDDRVLALTVRDHGTRETAQATALLRDAGFKVAYHLMPNLPGAEPADDVATFRRLFDDPAFRPDTMKIYPCVVTETAELHTWWQQGRYRPYDDETLVELLIELKQLVPPYVRIERVIRDIPSNSIVAGCRFINLREEVQRRLRQRGLRCRCVRCREVRDQAEGAFELTRREYDAAGGREIFLSFEERPSERLAALLRLRIPSATAPSIEALRGAALVRELHTYGRHVPLQARAEGAVQHHGFGRRLMQEAERIAREQFGRPRVAVIAGVGVREYYRGLGYRLDGTYMIKDL
jgi:elongator complex protein 3